ncbi:DUF3047 domain-containing protein [Thermodesulfobacteriota bacterium]
MKLRQGKVHMIKALSLVVLSLILTINPYDVQAESVVEVGIFSAAADDVIPPEWTPLIFKKIKRHTQYNLVKENGLMVLKASSDASASGLIRKIRIDPSHYPLIAWNWKITGVYEKGDVTSKDGDDYPARVYITFEYDGSKLSFLEKIKIEVARLIYGQTPPFCAITYIWASKAPKESIFPNPYTDRARMIVVESGDRKLNTWIKEERNVHDDYKKAFGKDPPHITGVAVMTDSDNTGESTITFYGDILFKTITSDMKQK